MAMFFLRVTGHVVQWTFRTGTYPHHSWKVSMYHFQPESRDSFFRQNEPGHCLDRVLGDCSLSNLLVVKYSNGWWRSIHSFSWFLLRHFWYLFPTSHRRPLCHWMAIFFPCLYWDQFYGSSTYHYIVLQNVSLHQIWSKIHETSTSDGYEEERRCYSCIPLFCHCSDWLSLLVTNCCNQNRCIHSHRHTT